MLRQYLSIAVAMLAVQGLSGCTSGTSDQGVAAQAPPAPAAQRPTAQDYGIPDSKQRFEIQNALIAQKLDAALLPAMRAQKIDMWIVLDREGNPDPLNTELGGRGTGVRSAYIFFDTGGDKLQKIYYGSHEQPANSVIARTYDEKKYYGYSKEGLTPYLRKAVFDRKPKRIGVDTSPTLPMADGLTAGLKEYLVATLGPDYARRLVSAELLIRDFRLNRQPLETDLYKQLLGWSARWMEEALSTANVVTGKTTAEDIAWWLEDRAMQLGLHGSGTVRVVREGVLLPIHDPHMAMQPGDIISIDGGLDYLGYETDIKRAAYILRPGETAVPEELMTAWKAAHAMGALYAKNMVVGRVGHEIWAAINKEAQAQGYEPVGPDAGGDAKTTNKPEVGIYGHSVGNVAHDIGARIAANIPFAYGDRVGYPLATGEWVSIELHVSTPIPSWGGKTWYARFEETGQTTAQGLTWLLAPQETLFLIEPAR